MRNTIQKISIISLLLLLLVSACSPSPGQGEISATTEAPEEQVTPTIVQTEEPTPTSPPQATPTEEMEPTETIPVEASATPPPEPTNTPTSEPTATVPAEPTLLTKSSFYGVSEDYDASGNVLIYQNPDGSYFVRLENFEVTSGPDLHVILAEDDNPFNLETLGDYADLGELKSTSGDQEYAIPPGTDLDKYGSVVIYCVPFHAIFAIAPVK